MDYDEMSNAYNRAKRGTEQPRLSFQKSLNIANYTEGDSFKNKEEVDYAILELNGAYIVARSKYLGSLDYSYVCTCDSHFEASLIVKGLSK